QAVHENLPFIRAMEVIAHEEAAAQQVFAEALHLFVGEGPVSDLDAVEPRPIVLIGFVEIDRLLHGADLNPREPSQNQREATVGAGIVHSPETPAPALPPIAEAAKASAETAEATATLGVRIHQAREDPLRLLLIVGRNGEVVVLKRRIFTPGLAEILECGE